MPGKYPATELFAAMVANNRRAGLPGHLRQRLLAPGLPRRFTLAKSVDDAKEMFDPPA
jgi:hypothetical protein